MNRNYTINFNSSFTFDEINKLPKLQNQYAQGLPLDGEEQFLGPESGVPFSWGPKISNLEFDGSAYIQACSDKMVWFACEYDKIDVLKV